MGNLDQKILVIDDEPQMRKLLKLTLETAGFKTISANSGNEGISFCITHKPELIILDLGLPDMKGQEVLENIRSWSDVPVIVLSVFNESEIIVDALNLGADDYMTKPFDANELLARVRVCLRRAIKKDFESSLFTYKHITVDLSARLVYKDGEEVKLTSTEYDMLKLFIKNPNRVLTNRQILKDIWGPNVSNSQYPRVYVRYLRQKIEKDPNNPEIIITEAGVGYRMKIKN